MSSTEYIKNLDIEQLEYLIQISEAKIQAIKAKAKVKYFAVSDDWLTYGYYKISELDAALEAFNKEFEKQIGKGSFGILSIKVEKYYPDEMKDLFE